MRRHLPDQRSTYDHDQCCRHLQGQCPSQTPKKRQLGVLRQTLDLVTDVLEKHRRGFNAWEVADPGAYRVQLGQLLAALGARLEMLVEHQTHVRRYIMIEIG
jgi:hypothetical protein